MQACHSLILHISKVISKRKTKMETSPTPFINVVGKRKMKINVRIPFFDAVGIRTGEWKFEFRLPSS